MNELIPTRIKEVRKNLHMSQTEFAELLGTTQVSVSALECGSRALSTDMALKIAKNCNVSVDWLCGLSDQKSAVSTPKTYSDVLRPLMALIELPIVQTQITKPHQLSLIICDEVIAEFFKNEAIMSEICKEEKGQSLYDAWIKDAYKQLNYPIADNPPSDGRSDK